MPDAIFEEQLTMAKMGIPDMMISVAYAYEFGVMGVVKDVEKAIHWYKKAGDKESLERTRALEEALNN